MKKFLIGLFALVLCVGMNSCKQQASAENAEPEKTAAEKVEAAPSLADVVAKAKAEGANWSVDEWKECFKTFALAIKPIMVKMNEITQKMEGAGESDPQAVAKFAEELQNITKEYPDFEKLMGEFNEIAGATENGKKVLDDEAWGEKMMEELGIPKM